MLWRSAALIFSLPLLSWGGTILTSLPPFDATSKGSNKMEDVS